MKNDQVMTQMALKAEVEKVIADYRTHCVSQGFDKQKTDVNVSQFDEAIRTGRLITRYYSGKTCTEARSERIERRAFCDNPDCFKEISIIEQQGSTQ